MPYPRLGIFAAWLGAMAAAPAFGQTAPADAARGKILFLECQSCHAVAPGGPALTGPSLQGIYGRRAASLPGYDYSLALKGSGITWTETTLDSWLADPNRLVPGTAMAFAGIASPTLRADLIAYLRTLK